MYVLGKRKLAIRPTVNCMQVIRPKMNKLAIWTKTQAGHPTYQSKAKQAGLSDLTTNTGLPTLHATKAGHSTKPRTQVIWTTKSDHPNLQHMVAIQPKTQADHPTYQRKASWPSDLTTNAGLPTLHTTQAGYSTKPRTQVIWT